MNKKVITVLSLILLFAGQPVAMGFFTENDEAPMTWSIETVDSDGVVGGDTSIALDSGGRPHISYYDATNDDLKYARWTGSTWSIETVDSAGNVGLSTSIALDSNDRPHISYHKLFGDLKYARWTGSAWSIETVSAVHVRGTSLALDSNDRPHISYYDYTEFNLKHARWTGSAWSIETVDSPGTYMHASIALDSGDRPHISYHYGDYEIGDLKYARWTGSEWSIETVDSDGIAGLSTSIALDSNDRPHISYHYYPEFGGGSLKYTRWTGSTWIIQTVDSCGAGSYGGFTSLALDSGDRPHISYPDGPGASWYLKYARWTGSYWNIENVDSNLKVGMDNSIALDSRDNPHISYYDFANHDLKYTRGLPSFQYHFKIVGSSNIFHVDCDAQGWINGYHTGGPENWNPVLGKVKGDRAYMIVDIHPDETPGYHETLFFTATISTMKGSYIVTDDGMSYNGPWGVTFEHVPASYEADGVDITETSSTGISSDTWYAFKLNPYIDIFHLKDNPPGGWLNGYDEPNHPCLGFVEGSDVYFCTDGLHTHYTLTFQTVRVGPYTGQLIRTTDGNEYDGPHNVWVSAASSGVESGEGVSALMR